MNGFKRVFLGSVAESLARTCPVPVLLVREVPSGRSVRGSCSISGGAVATLSQTT
nr:universal stress protein [uncultured Cupriavidus sp.]